MSKTVIADVVIMSKELHNQSVPSFTEEDIEIEQHMNGYYLRFYPKKKLSLKEAEAIKAYLTKRRES